MMAGASHARLRSPAQRGGLSEEKYKTSCEKGEIPKTRQRKEKERKGNDVWRWPVGCSG